MKKRIVSFLMALVMAVSLLPVSAFAVEDTASPDVPAVVEPEAQTAGEQQDERAGKQTETSAFAAEDAPFVLKADGQAVAVEKTPITGYTGGGRNDSATFPIYRASIYESTQKVQFEAKDSNIWYIADHTWGRPFPIKQKQNLPLSLLLRSTYAYVVDVTNTDTAKGPVFTLEDGKAITDVIDTTAKKTAYMDFTDGAKAFYGLILEIKAGSAPVEDENAPVVAGATLERITGSVYGSATNVYLAKLPADATSFSVTLQSDEFVRAGSSSTAKARKYYVSQAYLDSTDWYNSLDAVMEDRRAYNGYKSVEEMLKYYDGGYSSKEDFLKRGCGCETPAAFWDKTYNFVKCETTPLTMQTSAP